MLKLYKCSGAGIVVHRGKLGGRGKTRFLHPEDGQAPDQGLKEATE
jgi:hypothetical protein